MHDGGADGPWPLAVVHAMLPFKEIGPRRQYGFARNETNTNIQKEKRNSLFGCDWKPKSGWSPD